MSFSKYIAALGITILIVGLSGVYFLTHKIGQPSKKVIFIKVIIGNMFSRMMLTALVAVLYYQIRKPDDGMFIVPFILAYIGFTIFEAYFMTEQAKGDK